MSFWKRWFGREPSEGNPQAAGLEVPAPEGVAASEEVAASAPVSAAPAAPDPLAAAALHHRNDPCPCGSGKRYKHCHGRAHEGERVGQSASEGAEVVGAAAPVTLAAAAGDRANAASQHDLAVSHLKTGDALLAQGDRPGALAAYRKMLTVIAGLAASDPGNADWQHDLAVSHNKIGDLLLAQGDGAGALASCRKSLAIAEALVARDPGNADWQQNLAVSHQGIGDVLRVQGDGPRALAAYRQMLSVIEGLATRDPANTEWQRDLGVSHNKIGEMLRAQGDGPGALAAYRSMLSVIEGLATRDPGNTDWQQNLAVSHERIGNLLLAQDDRPGALAAYRSMLSVIEGLATRDPANTEWQRDLAASHNKIGEMLLAQGDGAGALAAYRKALVIAETLAARDPGNADWQQNLAVSHQGIGDVLRVQGDGPGALAAYRQMLSVIEGLATRDPANTEWQRDLGVSHIKIGDVLLAQDDRAGALAAYRKSFAIAEVLAARDPDNADWQHALAVSHERIGNLLLAQDDRPGALAVYRKSHDIFEGLVTRDPDNTEWQQNLAAVHKKIGDLLLAQDDAAGATALYRKSLALALHEYEPCPCGSGKRYKHCHGRLNEAAPFGQSTEAVPAATAVSAAGANRAIGQAIPASPPPAAAALSTLWRTRPVFITGTFQDLQAERDQLQQVVFPRLAEALRGRHHHLEPIDLRTGVEAAGESEQAREQRVLKVCLEEIERSRPYLIVILGDRYGWVPPEERARAAVEEAGFETVVSGRSVTALEIEFGLLVKDPAQRRRCFFYFRAPLPYGEMPPEQAARYSDAHAGDAQAAQRVSALAALKARLEGDPELGPRVRHYQPSWDAASGRVSGLGPWGEQVYADLWGDLEAETAAFAALPEPTSSEDKGRQALEAERQALGEFLELRRHDFRGRAELLQALTEFVHSDADAPWGICLSGESGAGKSALFAELYRRLEAEGEVWLLAHAAGVSPRANDVLAMLRRWVVELATFLGEPSPLAEDAKAEAIEAAFASLLGRAARQRRVVVLVDALNQFEPTPQARFVTWLPVLWPPNARLIATTVPGESAEALAAKPGISRRELPPLSREDAEAIARQVWARYHRSAPPQVLARLLAKTRPDGTPACGNALWLSFAAEQLNLLDADDFERAERDYPGPERFARLLCATAEALPADSEGLYGWLLERNSKTFGRALTEAFAAALALSRFGWRESDLAALVPRLAEELHPGSDLRAWDDLRLAGLRRSFRAHLAQRGEPVCWDFFHLQARRAVERTVMPDPSTRRRLHAAIVDHLEALPADDALRDRERMWHLIGAEDAARAARFYAEVGALRLQEPGVVYGNLAMVREHEATRTLATFILEAGPQADSAALAWVVSLLEAPDLDPDTIGHLAYRLQFDLHDALEHQARLEVRGRLLAATRAALERLTAADPANTVWQRGLAVSHNKIGDVLVAQGDGPEALAAYRKSLAIAEALVARDPANTDWQRDLAASHIDVLLLADEPVPRQMLALAANSAYQCDLAASHDRIGDVLRAEGDRPGALVAYLKALALRRALAARDPANTLWQRELALSHQKIGDVLVAQGDRAGALAVHTKMLAIAEALVARDPANTLWQHDLAVSHGNIGDLLIAQGDGPGALASCRKSLAIAEALVARDPDDTLWQRDLALSHQRIGDVLRAEGEGAGALAAYRSMLSVIEALAARDPANTEWQRALAGSHERIGVVLKAQGDGPGALASCRKSLALREVLAARDPANADWQSDVAVSHINIGDVLQTQGDGPGALAAYRKALAIAEALAARDPANTEWQHDLAVSHQRIGDVLRAQGDGPGALAAYRKALAIAEALAARGPANADWQRDLAVSHNKIGDVLGAQGDGPGALAAYRSMLSVIEALAARDPANTEWQRALAGSHDRIGDVLVAQGDGSGALAAYLKALALRKALAARDPATPSGSATSR